MSKLIKLVKVGDHVGIVLPDDVLAALKAELGDVLVLSDTPDGFGLAKADADFERAMALAGQIMEEDRGILRVLAR